MSLCSRIKLAFKAKTRKAGMGGNSQDLSPAAGQHETTTMQPPGQVVSPALQPAKSIPASQTASEANPRQASDDFDPWSRAYEILRTREPDLTGDYEKHLTSLQSDAATIPGPFNSQSIESIVKKLLDDREKKQWRVSLAGKDINVRDQCERLVKFVLWVDPVVKNAVSAQPYAALAWSGVSLLLPLLTSGTANNEVMLKGFNSICDIQLYWNTCEKTYFQPSRRENYKNLLEPLAKLYSHIFEYQARVICHLSRAQLSRTWQNVAHGNDWEGKEREVNELDARCHRYINHFDAEQFKMDRDIQLQEMQGSRSILDRIRMILDAGSKETKRIYEDQKERDLLRDLASDYEDYKDFNPQKVDGTCEWFFMDNRFRKWRDSNTSNLLWVSAGPGCGKSVLSRALIDERRLSTSVTTSTVCYFFFKDGYQGRMDATNALCAILHQLFMYSPADGLIGRALPSHKSYGKGLASNFSELWRILLDCADSSEAGEIVCVLDALDECRADSKQQLIGKLNQFYCRPRSSTSKLKFLITSRPYDDIEASFKEFPDKTAYLHFDGDGKSSQISKEINLVIDAKVNEIARDFEENDRKRISDQLKSIEHRTYLWLHLTFEIIKESPSEYSRRSDIETLLSGLPTKISEAYEKILDRSKNQDHTVTLLQIVLAATRPLTLDEANIALTLALEKQRFDSHGSLVSKMWPRHLFESTVKNLCGLFISVYESKLSFIHQTAREFLIHPQRERKWQGRFNVSDAHGKMSLVCLEYLTYIDAQDVPIKKLKVKFPLAQYSARYWMDHARPVEFEEEVQKSISDFFLQREHAYMTWGKLFDPDNPWRDEPRQRSMPIPLYYASLAGFQCAVDNLLLQEGMDANAQGGRYHNALQAASAKGYQGIIQFLLEKGADINAQGGRHGNALQAASAEGHQQIVQFLLEKGADINAQGGLYGNTLQAASAEGHQQIVQFLLEKGADINAQGGLYGNALQAASAEGHQQIVQFLLEKGADINAQGGLYGNALQAASAEGHQQIVQFLLEKGADINAQGGLYGNALQAASAEGHQQIIQLLLEHMVKPPSD